ncbi:MAG: hypothetical protein HQL77_03430 [Magnetococcales bacterium]|nr:hypothetical protein [Magnetococcales bacterium]
MERPLPPQKEMMSHHTQTSNPRLLNAMREDARFILTLMLLGCFTYLFAYAGWPLLPGREYWTFLEHYYGLQTGGAFFRPVGASYLLGWFFEMGRPGMVLAMLSTYLLFLLCVYMLGLAFSRTTARITSLIMLFHVQVTILFLKVDGDFLLCLAMALWSVLMMRYYKMEKSFGLFLLGLATFLPILFRQTAILYLTAAFFPLLCFGFTKKNLFKTMTIAAGFTAGLFCMLVYNQATFDRFSFPSLSGYIPTLHVYRFGPGFSAEYGPENRKLLQLVERELLAKPVYVENRVSIKDFLEYRWDIRKFSDLLYLDRVIDRGILFRASMESIVSRPGEFAKTIFSMILHMFVDAYSPALPEHSSKPASATPENLEDNQISDSGQPITPPSVPNPVNIHLAYSSTPEAMKQLNVPRILEKERKPTAKEQSIKKKLAEAWKMFEVQGNYHVAMIAKMALIPMVPPMLIFLAASLLLPFVDRFRKRARLLMVMLAPAFGVIMISGLVHQFPEYRLPFDFLIILGGIVGIQYNPWISKLFHPGPDREKGESAPGSLQGKAFEDRPGQ